MSLPAKAASLAPSHAGRSLRVPATAGRVLVVVALITVTVLAATMVVAARAGFSLDVLTRDPVNTYYFPRYAGFFSHLTILFWCGTMTICAFCALLFWQSNAGSGLLTFMVASSLLNMMLLADDLFLIHEYVDNFSLPFSQRHILLGYALVTLFYLVRWRQMLLSGDVVLLGFALACFAASMVLDVTVDFSADESFLGIRRTTWTAIEDGAKLLGVVVWFTYFVRLALGNVLRRA